jgi:hypothetical protein
MVPTVILWSGFLATDPEVPGSIPGFSSFLRNNESWTGSTQPHEYNWRAIGRKSSGSGVENREYGRRDPSRWPRDTLYPQKLALISPTRGGLSVDIVRWRIKATELLFIITIRISLTYISSLTLRYIHTTILGLQLRFEWKLKSVISVTYLCKAKKVKVVPLLI